LNNLFYVHFVTKVIKFMKSMHKTDVFIPNMTHFDIKKMSHLFSPQSADSETSCELQVTEKNFTTLVIFQKSVLLGLKV
jgi:hypothetical protein